LSSGPDDEAARDTFWNRREMAVRMGDRPPDERLVALLGAHPEVRRILDLGCAGGRNTVFAAERGLDVHAFDAAEAMVALTRERLRPIVGPDEARRRVRLARLEDEEAWRPADDAPFDLVLALGVLQDLTGDAAVRTAIGRIAGALVPGGRVLVANFGPDSRPAGTPLVPVDGAPHVFLGFAHDDRRMTLPGATTLEAWFEAAGLRTDAPTEVRTRPTDEGVRTTINARFRKPLSSGRTPG